MSLQLKRNQMKYFSSDNMRLLSSLILSLSSKQSAMEDKLIDYWTPSTAYIKDESMVIYGEAIHMCKISNADATFDQNKWLKLSPEITELTKDDISALINLSPEEISKLSDLISTEIRLDKVFSSSDTYMRIQAAIDTAKEYTNNQLGKAVKPAYKVVASTSEVTETGYFYLISNGTNYDMYVLSADGSVVSLGTSDVDLTQFYNKNYIDNNFYTSADVDGKFATITTVDGKVDKTNVLTALGSSATDDQVYSAKAMNTELDGVVKKTDISTTIDGTSTNDTVPTNKAVYDSAIKNKRLKTYSISSADDFSDSKTLLDISNNLPSNSIAVVDSGHDKTSFFGLPSDKFEIVWVRRYSGRDSIMAYTATGLSYICTNIKNQTWKKLCATTVADVSKTFVPFTIPSSITVYNPDRPDLFGLYYIVKNGVCYVDVTMSLASISQMNNFVTLCSGMPKPAISYVRNEINSWNDKTAPTITMAINGGESAFLIVARNMSTSPMTPSNSDGHFGYFCSFSYPVAEE